MASSQIELIDNTGIQEMNVPVTQMKSRSTAAVARKIYPPYIKSILTKKVTLHINEIGSNLVRNIEEKIASTIEGKCIEEGFIRPNTVKIVNYSCGIINMENIVFQVVFECFICHPVEGMELTCTIKAITKAGIHAEYIDTNNVVPIVAFVARDHHYSDKYFNSVKDGAKITVRIIGCRYELHDQQICVIAKLLPNV